MKSFASDYRCKPHPAVVQAVVDACAEPTDESYGADRITQNAVECIRRHFGQEVYPCFVSNGTAANRLALQTMLTRPYESVLCAKDAHINTAEAGALESLGHKLIPVPTSNGKITVAWLEKFVRQQSDIHLAYPSVISISNATELGTVYSEVEFEDLVNYACEADLTIHIDGARLANAAALRNIEILGNVVFGEETTPKLVVTLGTTKNGGMLGDAVIFFSKNDFDAAIRLQKQQGQLSARIHCIAAQITVMYSGNLWKENALNANSMAKLLSEKCQNTLGLQPAYPVQSNAVFMRIPHRLIPKLQAQTQFLVWDETEGIVRWMCSWDTTEDDVDQFVQLIKETMI